MGSGARHCSWAPKFGDVGGMTFSVGAGTVRPHVVMSRISVCVLGGGGQGDWKKKNGLGSGHRVRTRV